MCTDNPFACLTRNGFLSKAVTMYFTCSEVFHSWQDQDSSRTLSTSQSLFGKLCSIMDTLMRRDSFWIWRCPGSFYSKDLEQFADELRNSLAHNKRNKQCLCSGFSCLIFSWHWRRKYGNVMYNNPDVLITSFRFLNALSRSGSLSLSLSRRIVRASFHILGEANYRELFP